LFFSKDIILLEKTSITPGTGVYSNPGNEIYRILFNDDLKGYITNGPFFSVLGEDQYLYLFGFYESLTQVESFCISEVEVNQMVTSLQE
jgi:hypothetical protein